MNKKTNIRAIFCGILGLLVIALAPNLNAVGFNVTSPQQLDKQSVVFIEFFLTDNNVIGGFILPGGKVSLDTTVAGVTKIRWFFPEKCELYELNMNIPGILRWKDLKISSDAILLGASGIFDTIAGKYQGKRVFY